MKDGQFAFVQRPLDVLRASEVFGDTSSGGCELAKLGIVDCEVCGVCPGAVLVPARSGPCCGVCQMSTQHAAPGVEHEVVRRHLS